MTKEGDANDGETRLQAALWDNPMGTDGIEFVAPDPMAMGDRSGRLGFVAAARHRHKNVALYRQGRINEEGKGADGQIQEEDLERFHGEGVQHAALSTCACMRLPINLRFAPSRANDALVCRRHGGWP